MHDDMIQCDQCSVTYYFLVEPVIPWLDDCRSLSYSIQCDDIRAVNMNEKVVSGTTFLTRMIVVVVMVMALVAAISMIVVVIVRHGSGHGELLDDGAGLSARLR